VNAGRLLRNAGYDTDALRSRIAPVNPDTINIWPASPLFRLFWRKGIEGVTYWRYVIVDADVLRGDQDRLSRLVIHELVHVRQFSTLGYLPFVFSYVREYLSGRLRGLSGYDAYRAISFEREARELTAQIVQLR
jgi:hypothetical protein